MAVRAISQIASLIIFLQRKSAAKQYSDHNADAGALAGQQPRTEGHRPGWENQARGHESCLQHNVSPHSSGDDSV